MVRGDDLRHDIAAESRADLYKIGVFIHLQHCAVGCKPRFQPRGHARGKLPADSRRADQDRRRTRLCDKCFKDGGIRFNGKMAQRGVVADIDLVRAVVKQLVGGLADAAAHQEDADRLPDDGGQFARLSDQLECHRMQHAVLMVGINGDAAPL